MNTEINFSHQPDNTNTQKKQPFGTVSKKTLSDCAYSKTAHVETTKSDRYGRKVGKVMVDGVDCNLRQIKLGMA